MIEVLYIEDEPSKLQDCILKAQADGTLFEHEARELAGDKMHNIKLKIDRITIASEAGEFDDDIPSRVIIAIGSAAIDGSNEELPAMLRIHSAPNNITPPAELEISLDNDILYK